MVVFQGWWFVLLCELGWTCGQVVLMVLSVVLCVLCSDSSCLTLWKWKIDGGCGLCMSVMVLLRLCVWVLVFSSVDSFEESMNVMLFRLIMRLCVSVCSAFVSSCLSLLMLENVILSAIVMSVVCLLSVLVCTFIVLGSGGIVVF